VVQVAVAAVRSPAGKPLEVGQRIGHKTRQRNDECDVIRTDRGYRRREASEAVSNDSDPLRVHLRSCLEEGDARDQVTSELLHRRQLLLARRPAGTSVVDPQHDDPVSAQSIGDGQE